MDAFKDLHSEETERAALGCMFLDRSAAALGKTMLLADDFYTPMYRVIFEAMQGVEEIDAVTVMNELARRGEAERIGLDRIAGIALGISTSVYLHSYIDDLKRLAYLRRVVRTAQEMAQAAYRQDIGGIDRSMAAMRGDGWGSAEIVTLADATEKHIREIAALRESGKKIVGLPTGFTDLDLMLGGLRNGDFCILAARPSMGKSALALDIAKHAQKSLTEQADRVVFFSLEMPDKSLGNRGYTSEFLIDNDRFAVGANDAAWQETLRGVAENRADYESGARTDDHPRRDGADGGEDERVSAWLTGAGDSPAVHRGRLFTAHREQGAGQGARGWRNQPRLKADGAGLGLPGSGTFPAEPRTGRAR